MGNTLLDGLIILIFTLTALISTAFFTYFVLQAEYSKLFQSFIVLQFLQMLWLVTKILRMLAPTVEMSFYPALLQYISVCFLGAAYLNFAYHYCTGKRLPLLFRLLIFLLSTINYIFFATNPVHQQFFIVYDPNQSVRGPLFYVHTVSSYSMLLLGYIYLFRGFHKKVLANMGVYKYLIYGGLAVPFIINIMIQIGYINFPIDLTPLMFNIIYLAFGFIIYRYQFLNIRSIAKEDIYAHMQEGIMVFDHKLYLESTNDVILQVLPNGTKIKEGMSMSEIYQEISPHMVAYENIRLQLDQFFKSEENEKSIEMAIKNNGKQRYYQVNVNRTSEQTPRILVRAFGINRYIQAIHKLENQSADLEEINQDLSEEFAIKRRLAIAKERNRISGEIHDILGHSLTVVISLLEASKSCLEIDPQSSKEKLHMAMETTRHNLNNLKQSLSNPSNEGMTGDELLYDIKKIAESLKEAGTHVELITRGNDLILPNHYYDMIYHFCQEALTNAVRHGKAKEVTIAIRINSNEVDLTIIDNGLGSQEFKKGNGLSNIEKNIKSLNGFFSCGSPDGDGFSLHVKIPMP